MSLFAQRRDGGGDLVAPAAGERLLREEHVVADVERGEVVADHVEHRRHGGLAHDGQPFGLALASSARPCLRASSAPTGFR